MIKFISANAHVVEAGTFPFYRSEDAEEERLVVPRWLSRNCWWYTRRLLYVACTRAQCLLYLSYTERRKIAGEAKNKTLSPFLTSIRQVRVPRLPWIEYWYVIVTVYEYTPGLGFFSVSYDISNTRSHWTSRRASAIPDCSIVRPRCTIPQHEV